jgi:hypothetical protein
MTIRIVLPVVMETEEKRTAEMLGVTPTRYECEPMIFYEIDNVKQYDVYKNLCIVMSGGKEHIVGLPYEEVDKLIMEDLHPPFSAN